MLKWWIQITRAKIFQANITLRLIATAGRTAKWKPNRVVLEMSSANRATKEHLHVRCCTNYIFVHFFALSWIQQPSRNDRLQDGGSLISRECEHTTVTINFFLTDLDCEQSLIFFLQSYCTSESQARELRLVPIPCCNITSSFAIAPAEIRTRRILRENADCKQSVTDQTRRLY